eukprot:scaffold590745_cov59-Attheya_sp.AAC.1
MIPYSEGKAQNARRIHNFDKNFASGALEKLALATIRLNGLTCRLGEGMCLDGNVLGREIILSNNNLVHFMLGLGNSLGVEQTVD